MLQDYVGEGLVYNSRRRRIATLHDVQHRSDLTDATSRSHVRNSGVLPTTEEPGWWQGGRPVLEVAAGSGRVCTCWWTSPGSEVSIH